MPNTNSLSLRPYQQRAKEQIHTEWEQGRLRTLLVLPTGTGKTIVFAAVAEDQVRAGDRVLILAHRGELLEQAADKLQKSTGLGCAVEKAEQSCLASWYPALPLAACKACSAPSGWKSSPTIISAPSSLTKPTMP